MLMTFLAVAGAVTEFSSTYPSRSLSTPPLPAEVTTTMSGCWWMKSSNWTDSTSYAPA